MGSAPIYITPRKKAPTWRCGSLRPPRCHRPSRDAQVAQMVVRERSHPERVENRMGSAGSRLSQRNSTRILGTLTPNYALRRTSARPCSASRTSRDPSHRPVRRHEVCPHPAAVFVPGSITTDLRPLCAARPALRGCHPLGLAAREHSDSRPAGLTYSGRQRSAPRQLT